MGPIKPAFAAHSSHEQEPENLTAAEGGALKPKISPPRDPSVPDGHPYSERSDHQLGALYGYWSPGGAGDHVEKLAAPVALPRPRRRGEKAKASADSLRALNFIGVRSARATDDTEDEYQSRLGSAAALTKRK